MILSTAILPFAAPLLAAASTENPFTNPLGPDAETQSAACGEGKMAAFGKYIGRWQFVDSQMRPDGSWAEGQGGNWDFYCLGSGLAVQDFWQPKAGGFGATLRMYDEANDRWDVVFSGEGSQAMSHLTATQLEDGSVEMHYVRPAYDPMRRITFSPLREHGFDWTLAISRDEGATWIDVYKMKVTPRAD